ncbi:TPA: phage tail protein, partial [Serratia marcescens]
DAMNTITAQLAAETAKALRGLNLDKNNWQQVFSGTGNITVTLPDGSTYTGPAWNSFTSALNLKADKTELDKKADKSSLGSLASKNSITRSELNNELVRNLFASGARSKNDGGAGVWTFDNTPWGFDTQYGIAIQVNNRTDTS